MISRREFLARSSAVPLGYSLSALAAEAAAPDYRLEIGPATVEVAPGRRIGTTAYNGQVPGPVLLLKEGRPVVIDVTNASDRPEVVHWHGLYLPPGVDGAMEEGTPSIPPKSTTRYAFTPAPAGFRWYHTHTMAMGDFTHGQYSGQHGVIMVEPRENPARYDQEIFLVLHDWEGYLAADPDGAMNPQYKVSTINGRTLGFGEPLRVGQGRQVLLHVLNSSPTEVHWLAFAGHEFRVIAMDGNPVPAPRTVPMLRLAPAERICAIVETNNPGVWVLGEVRKHIRENGMGVVVEYAERTGVPRWQQPAQLAWNYEQFSAPVGRVQPADEAIPIPLVFESKFHGHGGMESWTINGKSYPDVTAPVLQQGKRYRLQFINQSSDDHPLHLHRHSFELRRVLGKDVRGVFKDTVLVGAQTRTEVEFIADHPGPTLFHCHQQNHMDLGFMMLFNYG